MESEATSARDWLEMTKGRGMRLGLATTEQMLERLGNPEATFPAIHVAGSNGKGSTCAMLSNLLRDSGLRVGMFNSPHLCRIEERVRIDGRLITEEEFTRHLKHIRAAADESPTLEPTFYEVTFLVSLLAFAAAEVDWAVVETGLGGRLDATRLVQAEVCVLTSLSLEHTDVLGESLAEIAAEKVAIAREGKPLLARFTEDSDAREQILAAVDADLGYWFVPEVQGVFPFSEGLPALEESLREADDPERYFRYDPAPDPYLEAWDLALVTLNLLEIDIDHTVVDIMQVRHSTQIPGRMQTLFTTEDEEADPFWLIDCAHNPDGMRFAFSVFESWISDNPCRVLLLGSTQQEDIDSFLDPVVDFANRFGFEFIVVTEPRGGRTQSLDCDRLERHLREQIPDTALRIERDVSAAVTLVQNWLVSQRGEFQQTGLRNQPVAVCVGSLYLAGNVLSELGKDSPEELAI